MSRLSLRDASCRADPPCRNDAIASSGAQTHDSDVLDAPALTASRTRLQQSPHRGRCHKPTHLPDGGLVLAAERSCERRPAQPDRHSRTLACAERAGREGASGAAHSGVVIRAVSHHAHDDRSLWTLPRPLPHEEKRGKRRGQLSAQGLPRRHSPTQHRKSGRQRQSRG